MKLVIFADSHTDLDTMRLVVEAENPDIIVHLGDHIRDGMVLRELFVDIPMELVKEIQTKQMTILQKNYFCWMIN